MTTWWRTLTVLCLVLTAAAESHAQKFTTLHTFSGTDGKSPNTALIQGTDGNLYGITAGGGAFGNYGTIFKITPQGMFTTFHSFNGTDGTNPSSLTQGGDGNYYGTTASGGAKNAGTIFKITPGGTLTTLYPFCSLSDCADGSDPTGLLWARDGELYGMTIAGGLSGTCQSAGCGTLFGLRLTPSVKLTTLYSFCSHTGCTDGSNPTDLFQASATDTSFFGYGTTQFGGADNGGTVFTVARVGGLVQTLDSFLGTDGLFPNGLTQAANGAFYGTTKSGGLDGGTVFEVTTGGALTPVYSFCAQTGCTDGSNPFAGVVQGTDQNFYGTTKNGGANSVCQPAGCGTVFRVTPGGQIQTLHSFCAQSGCPDGSGPITALIQDTNGSFYGTTHNGGTSNDGTVFSLAVGLGKFVAPVPTSEVVQAQIQILGTNLTGATAVSFNGTPATTFSVNSTGTAISAKVPAGATTGFITVTTPSGTLKSNVVFQVKQ